MHMFTFLIIFITRYSCKKIMNSYFLDTWPKFFFSSWILYNTSITYSHECIWKNPWNNTIIIRAIYCVCIIIIIYFVNLLKLISMYTFCLYCMWFIKYLNFYLLWSVEVFAYKIILYFIFFSIRKTAFLKKFVFSLTSLNNTLDKSTIKTTAFNKFFQTIFQ